MNVTHRIPVAEATQWDIDILVEKLDRAAKVARSSRRVHREDGGRLLLALERPAF